MWEDDKELWHGRRYYALNAYFKNCYGRRIDKIAVDAGFTCPNRDGTYGHRGCSFCSAGGSGDFAVSLSGLTCSSPSIIYFQAFTGTYAPVAKLRLLYEQALSLKNVVGISIATRPDCLPPDVLDLLQELSLTHADQTIWIELGLQTIHQATADAIRRGYNLACFEEAVHRLHERNIPVIVHTILGLPGETKAMMRETTLYLGTLPIFGIKLQLLHILKDTDLADGFLRGTVRALTKEEYIDALLDSLSHLPPHIVIHRLTGDGPRDLLLAPLWSLRKKDVLNEIAHRMKIENCYQGKHWKG